jgi:peptide deformylase
MLPIVIYGHPVLKQRGVEIEIMDGRIEDLITNMFETLEHVDGLGLAAPQVNESLRLFVIADSDDEEDKRETTGRWPGRVFINPEIIKRSGLINSQVEGCLSIPAIEGSVIRHNDIVMKYRDENFKEKQEKFNGFEARVIQHEYDHTEGMLMTDRINAFRQKSIRPFLKRLSKGEVETDYQMIFK